jgi:hypothetical protein
MTYHPIEFDGDTYMRDLDRAIRKLMREAAREWLMTVLNTIDSAKRTRKGKIVDPYTINDTFPIVTGEAKGSLIPLGRSLHVDVPVRPKPGRPNRIAKGMGQGTFIYPQEQRGPGTIRADYFFNFQSRVEHFRINEISKDATEKKGLLSRTPWGAFAAANKVFEDFMNTHLFSRVPRVNSYFYTGERISGARFTSPTFQR